MNTGLFQICKFRKKILIIKSKGDKKYGVKFNY